MTAGRRRVALVLHDAGKALTKRAKAQEGKLLQPATRFTGRALLSGSRRLSLPTTSAGSAEGKSAKLARAATGKSADVGTIQKLVVERRRIESTTLIQVLAELAARDEPVIVGPFLGEVGFELLYWVPFVRWALAEFPELDGRLIVTSRGGTASWYGEGIRDYIDVLDVFSPEEFVERRQRTKQRGALTPLEVEFLSAVRARAGIEHALHLHPDPLWRAYYQYVKADARAYPGAVRQADDAGPSLLGLNAVYTPISPPPMPQLDNVLPEGDFVAARFYFRPSFPDTPANRSFAASLVQALAERTPVVLLNNRLELDEHRDLDFGSPRIIPIHEHMTPADNLAVQTAVVSRARAFFGTYGGLAYLPPYLGVPVLTFLEDALEPKPWHLELAQQVFRGPPWGSISLMTTRGASLLGLLAGTDFGVLASAAAGATA